MNAVFAGRPAACSSARRRGLYRGAWRGTLVYRLYDHYGLDWPDILKFQNYPLAGDGFVALYILQHLLAPPRPWTMRFVSQTSDLCEWLPTVHTPRTRRTIDPVALDTALQSVLSLNRQVRAANG
jgi:hypothetical protein